MKKFSVVIRAFIPAFAVIILCSCVKENLSTNNWKKMEHESIFTVKQEVAFMAAINFANAMFQNTTTKASDNRALANVEVLMPSAISTKSSGAYPIGYLFNFADNKGYVLISADKRYKDRVYMASEQGKLSLDNLRKSPYAFILDYIEHYQERAYEEKPVMTKADDGSYSTLETITSTNTKGPLLSTKWDQYFPYNYYLSTNFSYGYIPMGCTAIAMGQTLAYYQKPAVIATGGINYNIDWNTIANQTYSNTYPYLTNDSESWNMAVSYFTYAIGKLIGINYENAQSGATFTQVRNAYSAIGAYYSYSENYSIDNITTSLNSNKPVYIRASESNSSIGHAWVIDGYKQLTVEIATYDENGNIVENTILNNDYNYTSYRKYWHCNFGWKGVDDGYYKYYNDNFIDGSHLVYIYSSIFNTTDNYLNNDIKIIYNISI